MHGIWRDLQYGFRGLRKQPGFTVLAVLALALGIGAATTIFSVIQNVLLDPFPYKDSHRVVTFYIHDVKDRGPYGRSFFKPEEFLDYQEQARSFEEVIGSGVEDVLYTTAEGTVQFDGAYVTPNQFSFLGVPAMLGRTTTPDDVKPGAPPVFVLAYKCWVKNFNSDPNILGKVYTLNGVPTTLVGVMPKRFTKRAADLYRPYALDRADPRVSQLYFQFQARLKPGLTPRDVESEIGVIAHNLAKQYPDRYPPEFTVRAESWVDSIVGQFKTTLLTLAAAVGLVLLIACANVANMLLARATVREKEMAIRNSMGATRWRVIRQLLCESLLLGLGGALVGCVFSWAGLKAIVNLIPDGAIPKEADIRLNFPVMFFSLGISVLTALIFGLVPALQAAKKDIIEPLRDSGKGVSGGFRRGKLRNTLVVVEVALSLVLLSGAGLLMRSFVSLQTVDLGMNPDNVLSVRLPLPPAQYKAPNSKQQFFSKLMTRVRAIPGVLAASPATSLPPYGGIGSEIDIPGKTHTERWGSMYQLVDQGYFPTLGLKIVSGRALNEIEVTGARKSAVVNQAFVKKYFGKENPLGQMVRIKNLETDREYQIPNAMFEIVGVTADAKNQGIQEDPRPEMFIPYSITNQYFRGLLVRTAGDPMATLNAVRREIWNVDRGVAVTNAGSLNDFLSQYSYAGPRFSLMLLGVFAGVGLALVALGVYSVIAYTVSRQTHEIGIRMALGAAQGDVFGMVLRMGLKLLAIGVAAGLAASLGVTRVLQAQLWNISPRDPMTFGIVVGVVTIVGLAACYFPARRATRVDPMVALRYQ
ncbi:MAG TPA: ABC transporter permease [Bryobacteraceae bacterium]|nr:ABC transporter permease [Bryobacteraceae bacterium]